MNQPDIAVKAAKPMTLKEAVNILKYHSEWRKGKDCAQIDPEELTEALEVAINLLEPMTK